MLKKKYGKKPSWFKSSSSKILALLARNEISSRNWILHTVQGNEGLREKIINGNPVDLNKN